MKRNTLLNQKGLTLIELLAASVLTSIIAIFSISLIVQAMNTTNRIQDEASIREEADLIMSQLVRELYTTNATSIVDVDGSDQGIRDNHLLIKHPTTSPEMPADTSSLTCYTDALTSFEVCELATGFFTNDLGVTNLVINNKEVPILSQNIIIESATLEMGRNSSSDYLTYSINLRLSILEDNTPRKTFEFNNEVPVINDL